MKKVLLVTNKFDGSVLSLFSLFLRWVLGGPNHCAILIGDEVHEMVGSSILWSVKRWLGRKVSYLPNEGSGYIVTPYDVWLKKSTRNVKLYHPLVELTIPTIESGYGFFDLIQIGFHLLRKKLNIGHSWNGVDGIPKGWDGVVCSEFVSKALGRNRHTDTPTSLQFVAELEFAFEFETKKG